MEFVDGEVVRETQYFGDPFSPGPSRVQWVEPHRLTAVSDVGGLPDQVNQRRNQRHHMVVVVAPVHLGEAEVVLSG